MTGEPLSLKSAQEQVDQWIRSTRTGYFDEMTNLARLAEEVGELARIYCRTRGGLTPKAGEDVSHAALAGEMGDTLFVLLCLANQAGISMDDAFRGVLDKIHSRDADRHK
ncbi:MAG: nucleotide pyrophosphohydrolase [Spirochaetia bacterium]|nr:nucleotide pyrophosphohydrolase [Spirochaetia bacterium]